MRDLVPFIDKTYRTKTARESRAIAGLSMGGAQTIYTAFNNLDRFAWVASMSGGFPLMAAIAVNIPPPPNAAQLRGPDITRTIDTEKFAQLIPNLDANLNGRLRLFYLTIGTDDGLTSAHAALVNLLKARGVNATIVEVPGYAHEWRFWRMALADLLPRLFVPAVK